jgi:hypothetical protein
MKNESEINRLLDLHIQTGDSKYWGEAVALIDPEEFADRQVKNIEVVNED